MKKWLFVPLLFSINAGAQSDSYRINTSNITIARDSFGVPHIFAPTEVKKAKLKVKGIPVTGEGVSSGE